MTELTPGQEVAVPRVISATTVHPCWCYGCLEAVSAACWCWWLRSWKVLPFSVLIRLTETFGAEKIFVLLKVKDHIYFKMGLQFQSDVSVRLGEDEERTRRSKQEKKKSCLVKGIIVIRRNLLWCLFGPVQWGSVDFGLDPTPLPDIHGDSGSSRNKTRLFTRDHAIVPAPFDVQHFLFCWFKPFILFNINTRWEQSGCSIAMVTWQALTDMRRRPKDDTTMLASS